MGLKDVTNQVKQAIPAQKAVPQRAMPSKECQQVAQREPAPSYEQYMAEMRGPRDRSQFFGEPLYLRREAPVRPGLEGGPQPAIFPRSGAAQTPEWIQNAGGPAGAGFFDAGVAGRVNNAMRDVNRPMEYPTPGYMEPQGNRIIRPIQ